MISLSSIFWLVNSNSTVSLSAINLWDKKNHVIRGPNVGTYIHPQIIKKKFPHNRPHLRYFQQTSFGLLWSPTCADHDWWSQSSLEGGPWTAKETRNVIIPSHPLSPNLSIRKQQRLLSYSYYISTIPKIYLLNS